MSAVFVQKDKKKIRLRCVFTKCLFAFPTIKWIVILNSSLSVSILSVFNFSLGHLVAHAAPDMRVRAIRILAINELRIESYSSANLKRFCFLFQIPVNSQFIGSWPISVPSVTLGSTCRIDQVIDFLRTYEQPLIAAQTTKTKANGLQSHTPCGMNRAQK